MIADILNHLWQSTVFVAAVAVLSLAFRHNRARLRYGLWFCASVKFLVPFAALAAIGDLLQWTQAPASIASVMTSPVAQEFSEPFADTSLDTAVLVAATRIPDWIAPLLFGVWLCGVAVIASRRAKQWRRVRAALIASSPWQATAASPADIPVRTAPTVLEPGVFGLWKPVIVLPARIEAHLTATQLAAVLAHEECHARCRDGLTAVVHMLVEAIFWFHPMVWWVGGRLIIEREQACDEHVVAETAEPVAYAEGILTVCKRYVESPLMNVAGVGGADIRARIHSILSNRIGANLSLPKRIALAMAAVTALMVPIVVGSLEAAALTAAQAREVAAFAAATVKPTPSEARGEIEPSIVMFLPSGGFRRTNSTLRTLVRTAYGVHEYQVVGGPSWTDDDRYDIEAASEEPAPRDVTLKKIQGLLADRFKLQVRQTTREGDVYHLVVSRGGSKLRPVTESTPADVRIGSYSGHRTVAQIADYLGRIVGRPVVDRTGVQGIFDIQLKFTPDPSATAGVSIFTAVREELGLELEPARGSMDVVEILSAAKPSEN